MKEPKTHFQSCSSNVNMTNNNHESKVNLECTEPLYIGKANSPLDPIPSRKEKTFIIGVGFELPKNPFHHHFQGISQLPESLKKELKSYQQECFDFTLRSTLILYDKFGFCMKCSELKKRMEANSFQYDRRRRTYDTVRIQMEENGTFSWSFVGGMYKSKKGGFLRQMFRRIRTVDERLSEGPLFECKRSKLDEDLYIQNDSHSDIEQIRLKIVDTLELYHLVLALHFTAPETYLARKSDIGAKVLKHELILSKLMPPIKPYVRVIDEDLGLEIMKYYPIHLPKLSIVLEIDRIPLRPKHVDIYQEHIEKRTAMNNLQNANRIKDFQQKKISENVYRILPKSDATHCGPVRVRNVCYHQSDCLNELPVKKRGIFSKKNLKRMETCQPRFQKKNLLPFEQRRKQSLPMVETFKAQNGDITVLEDDEDRPECSWYITPLRQEWKYYPRGNIPSEHLLQNFVYISDINSFGVHVPKLPKSWSVTIHEGRFEESLPLFCVLSANSLQNTQKLRTKVSRKHKYEEKCEFAIQKGYRACGFLLEVFMKRYKSKSVLVGQGCKNFGSLKLKDVEKGVYLWLPICHGKRQHGAISLTVSLKWRNGY